MSSELIPLAEAAQMLGMSAEKLTEMRSNNEIFGVRDGSSWKFKKAELERVADDMGITLQAAAGDEFELSDHSGKDLISDLDTPVEDEASASGMLSDSEDMLLADSDASGSAIGDSGELSFGESDISLASKIGDPNASDSAAGKDNELELVDEDLFEDNELSLQDSVALEDGSDLSSDFVDSSDVIIDDSDSNAADADDLILDEEDLVVSQGDDDDDFALSDSDLLDLGDGDGADDFDLEPVNESMDDQSSSSQVIALEDSELMDDSNATVMLDNASGDLVSDDYGSSPDAMPLESFDAPGPGEASYDDDGMVTVPAEPPYSGAQIVSLGLTMFFMALLVVLTLNLAQNMWQPSDSGFTSTIANWIANDVLGFRG